MDLKAIIPVPPQALDRYHCAGTCPYLVAVKAESSLAKALGQYEILRCSLWSSELKENPSGDPHRCRKCLTYCLTPDDLIARGLMELRRDSIDYDAVDDYFIRKED